MNPEATEGGRRLNAALIADHAALEATLRRISADLRSGQADQVLPAWQTIEFDLGAHLRAEEQLILPTFERAYPHHAALIRRHHDEIRRLLECMSVEMSRGTLGAHAVDTLLELLQRHARHEEVVFYYWAQLHLDEEDAQRAAERLRAASPRRERKPPTR